MNNVESSAAVEYAKNFHNKKLSELQELLDKKFEAIKQAQIDGADQDQIEKFAKEVDDLYEEMKMVNPAVSLSAMETLIMNQAHNLNKGKTESAGQMDYRKLDAELINEAEELNRRDPKKHD